MEFRLSWERRAAECWTLCLPQAEAGLGRLSLTRHRYPEAITSRHRLPVAGGPETINLGNCHGALFRILRASEGVSEDRLLSLCGVI